MIVDPMYLGRFVKTYPRRDGRDRVALEVPKALRPAGWPATLRLPERGRQIGSIADPRFRERVIDDAERLNRRLDDRRAAASRLAQPGRRTVAELGEILFKTIKFREVSIGQQKRFRRAVSKFVDWSINRGNPDFADLVKSDIEDFLYLYDGKPSAQTEFLFVWNRLAKEAMGNKWRTDNPCLGIAWPNLDPKEIAIWTPEIVDLYADAADGMGQYGLGALIRFNFLAGQRLGDVRTAKFSENFNGERFTCKQSKTGKVVTFLVPGQLARMVEKARYEGSDFMFTDFDTGKGFTANNLVDRFRELRDVVERDGGQVFYLRTLRHAAVCRLVAANVPLLKITAVTGHAPEHAERIIKRYAVDIERFADSAIRDMHRAEGGSDDDFSDTLPLINKDWLARLDKKERYVSYYTRAVNRVPRYENGARSAM